MKTSKSHRARRFAAALIAALAFTFTLGVGQATADDTSSIAFVADHADSAKGLVNGSFKSFELTAAHVDTENLSASWAEYSIDISSIDTGNSMRDDHLKSADFFDLKSFATASLRIDDIAKAGESYTATATLNLHGITKEVPVTFVVVEKKSKNHVIVEGSATLNRRTFDVGGAPEATGAAESVEVKVRLDVSTKKGDKT